MVIPRAFSQRVGVEEGIFVIHPAQLADAARAVEHCLGEGGLAGVYMGKDAHHQLFFAFSAMSAALTLRLR